GPRVLVLEVRKDYIGGVVRDGDLLELRAAVIPEHVARVALGGGELLLRPVDGGVPDRARRGADDQRRGDDARHARQELARLERHDLDRAPRPSPASTPTRPGEAAGMRLAIDPGLPVDTRHRELLGWLGLRGMVVS